MNESGTTLKHSLNQNKFTVEECINILYNTKLLFGVDKGGSLPITDFNFVIVKTTNKKHPNFIKQIITSFLFFGCIKLNQNKSIVTILFNEGDLR